MFRNLADNPSPKRHPEYYFEDGSIIFLVENYLFRVHRYFFVRESVVFRDMLSIPSGSEKATEGLADDKPIKLQGVKSIDFERMMWMFYNARYSDYSASAEKWASIIALAHMWQFETMGQVAFKTYVACPDIRPADKIAMGQKYDFPREDMFQVYMDICTKHNPLSVEEGEKVGAKTMILIAQTRDEVRLYGDHGKRIERAVTNNLVELKPSVFYR